MHHFALMELFYSTFTRTELLFILLCVRLVLSAGQRNQRIQLGRQPLHVYSIYSIVLLCLGIVRFYFNEFQQWHKKCLIISRDHIVMHSNGDIFSLAVHVAKPIQSMLSVSNVKSSLWAVPNRARDLVPRDFDSSNSHRQLV